MYELALNVTVLCEKYLGLFEIISRGDVKAESAAEELLDIIMTNGNFGRKKLTGQQNNEEKFSSVAYSIKTMGLYPFLQQVGMGTWTLYKRHPWLKPFAFIYAFFRLLRRGAAAAIHTKNFKQHIQDGKNRYDNYKKLGIRSKDQQP